MEKDSVQLGVTVDMVETYEKTKRLVELLKEANHWQMNWLTKKSQ